MKTKPSDSMFYYSFAEAYNEGQSINDITNMMDDYLMNGIIDFTEYNKCLAFLAGREKEEKQCD